MCFAWVIVFQHHILLAKQSLSEKISHFYTLQFTQKEKQRQNTWLLIHLDDYRPLNRASCWLLQTTSQMCGAVYFSGLRQP